MMHNIKKLLSLAALCTLFGCPGKTGNVSGINTEDADKKKLAQEEVSHKLTYEALEIKPTKDALSGDEDVTFSFRVVNAGTKEVDLKSCTVDLVLADVQNSVSIADGAISDGNSSSGSFTHHFVSEKLAPSAATAEITKYKFSNFDSHARHTEVMLTLRDPAGKVLSRKAITWTHERALLLKD